MTDENMTPAQKAEALQMAEAFMCAADDYRHAYKLPPNTLVKVIIPRNEDIGRAAFEEAALRMEGADVIIDWSEWE